jgi:hypothetical protein
MQPVEANVGALGEAVSLRRCRAGRALQAIWARVDKNTVRSQATIAVDHAHQSVGHATVACAIPPLCFCKIFTWLCAE